MSDAEQRAWAVVRQAYEERSPTPRRSRRPLVPVLAAAAVVVGAAIATPPGHAVFQKVREAVGVQHAEPALFSLPSHGRLLVVSSGHGGVWLIHDDGLKRRIGSYTDAQWSPHGLYVIATTPHQLVALDVNDGVRWTLPRRAFWPRWEGTRVDTRIAYMTPAGLRVVAGDGTGDHLLDRRARAVPPAWDPLRLHAVAAFSGGGAIVLRDADSGHVVWRTPIGVVPNDLIWSSDGRYLAVTTSKKVIVLTQQGRVHRTVTTLTDRFVDAAFQPGTHRLALSIRTATGSQVRVVDVDRPGRARTLFAGPGTFGDFVWSPDGRWLLLAWPTADQWLFLHGSRVRAVGNIEEQFPRRDHRGPVLQLDQRWCCAR
jgi:hypothetical protein